MAVVTYASLGAVRIDIDGKWKPNYWLIAYYVICILIMANLASFFWGRGQAVSAMAIVPMLLLVFIFFGIRWNWFLEKAPPGKKVADDACADADSAINSPNTPFPPIVNMCPDFMSAWKDTANDKVYCYDAANTYGLKTSTASGLISGLNINSVTGQSAYLLQNPTGADVGTKNPLQTTLTTNPTTLTAGSPFVRWEGVWDGRSMNPKRIPAI